MEDNKKDIPLVTAKTNQFLLISNALKWKKNLLQVKIRPNEK